MAKDKELKYALEQLKKRITGIESGSLRPDGLSLREITEIEMHKEEFVRKHGHPKKEKKK